MKEYIQQALRKAYEIKRMVKTKAKVLSLEQGMTFENFDDLFESARTIEFPVLIEEPSIDFSHYDKIIHAHVNDFEERITFAVSIYLAFCNLNACEYPRSAYSPFKLLLYEWARYTICSNAYIRNPNWINEVPKELLLAFAERATVMVVEPEFFEDLPNGEFQASYEASRVRETEEEQIGLEIGDLMKRLKKGYDGPDVFNTLLYGSPLRWSKKVDKIDPVLCLPFDLMNLVGEPYASLLQEIEGEAKEVL